MIATMGLMLTACQEKKQPYNIIVKKEQAPKPTKTLAIGDYVQKYHVEWLGKDYTITVAAKADSTLDKVSDGTHKYYDNRIALTINREDGTQFLHREFTKHDFSAHVDAGYLDNSALVGIVYDKIDGDNLTFAVSVGSPDKSSDDYVPLLIKIGRTGSVSVSKDTRLDTSSADEAADEVF